MLIKNSVFLVIGGASDDFGIATVEKLLKEGAKVIICDSPTKTLHIYGDEMAIFLPINIHAENDAETLGAIIKDKFGRLDGVINCIDYYKVVPIYDFKERAVHSIQDFSKIIQKLVCRGNWNFVLNERVPIENVMGLFNILRFLVPIIAQNTPKRKSGRGVIINMSNLSALDGQKYTCAYSASKAAVVGMTEAMAAELEPLRIRCVTLATKTMGGRVTNRFFSSCFDNQDNSPKFTKEPSEFAQLVKNVIEQPMVNTSLVKMEGLD